MIHELRGSPKVLIESETDDDDDDVMAESSGLTSAAAAGMNELEVL